MSKSSRKSIVASFGLLSQELESKLADDPHPVPPPAPSPRVGAGVVGAAHRAIDDIRAERDRLRAIVETGGGAILDLDPAFIDPSPIPTGCRTTTPAILRRSRVRSSPKGKRFLFRFGATRRPPGAIRLSMATGAGVLPGSLGAPFVRSRLRSPTWIWSSRKASRMPAGRT